MNELSLTLLLSFWFVIGNYQNGIEIGLFRLVLLTITNVPQCMALLKPINFVGISRTWDQSLGVEKHTHLYFDKLQIIN